MFQKEMIKAKAHMYLFFRQRDRAKHASPIASIEPSVKLIIRFEREMCSRYKMIVRILPLLVGCLEQSIFRLDLSDIAPYYIDAFVQNYKLAESGFQIR